MKTADLNETASSIARSQQYFNKLSLFFYVLQFEVVGVTAFFAVKNAIGAGRDLP